MAEYSSVARQLFSKARKVQQVDAELAEELSAEKERRVKSERKYCSEKAVWVDRKQSLELELQEERRSRQEAEALLLTRTKTLEQELVKETLRTAYLEADLRSVLQENRELSSMMEHISSEARAAVEAEHCLREISEEMRSPVILAAAKIDARELQNQAAEAERRAEILAKRLAAAEESARLAKLKAAEEQEAIKRLQKQHDAVTEVLTRTFRKIKLLQAENL